MRRNCFSILLAIALTGCAQALGINLERMSAQGIQPTPYPDSVKVSEVKESFTGIRWVATTPSGVYDCSRMGDEVIPICARRKTSAP